MQILAGQIVQKRVNTLIYYLSFSYRTTLMLMNMNSLMTIMDSV
jgi:hypothetical protein